MVSVKVEPRRQSEELPAVHYAKQEHPANTLDLVDFVTENNEALSDKKFDRGVWEDAKPLSGTMLHDGEQCRRGDN